MNWLRKLFFNLYYFGSPPWDTGITPPELSGFIASHPPGRALDLGCGTGTNAIALGQAGWETVGVDFAARAVRRARQKADRLGLAVRFFHDDVTKLSGIRGKFDLILDIGCFHGIGAGKLEDYAQNIAGRLKPGGTFLLYVFFRAPDSGGPGTTEDELEATFSALEQTRREDGTNRGERASAWLWYRLQEEEGSPRVR